MTLKLHSDLFERIRFRGQPQANSKSTVLDGKVRFTVLTPRLLRLEWSDTGEFEDRGTFAFPTRRAPSPSFITDLREHSLSIDTGALCLHYARGSGKFTPANLTIDYELEGQQQTWRPGLHNTLNLRGTRRTLDRCAGDASLEEGLISRTGWSLFDDTGAVLFDPADGWVQPPRQHQVQDWYFCCYGHDYREALSDYTHFGGRIPLIPRYALGAWWSRYWAYSDAELRKLVLDFEAHNLPLDVLVVDMDWHTPHAWTGYTWNRELFPDPAAFVQWVHDKGLRVTLNLHPAEGVQPFEEIYPRFAAAMGIDPNSGEAIPFQISQKAFVQHYLELLHHPMEDGATQGGTGIDFWWIDWQQGEASEMPGLDPLPWLNHLHFADSARRDRRPMIYSRWGGLGSHRYQTGFSGDTWVGWPALQFQPHFTATASNVGFGWWGHDIGGHMGAPTEPELYARWVQFGALSPSLRLHATKDPLFERRPWKFPQAAYQAAKAAFQWRYQLLPYIYTMARIAHDTGISLCRPMYYEYPEEEAAYTARFQYFFGEQMIAAPFVEPADPDSGLAATDLWVPPGDWIELTTKETFTGPRWVRQVGDLNRVPMLIRSGGILPLAAPFQAPASSHLASGTTEAIPQDRLILSVFPGPEGYFRLYEDDGLTEAYKAGQYEWTQVATRIDDTHTWVVHIAPVEGQCATLPTRRGYEIRLEGSRRPDRVMLNGVQASDWSYDAQALRTIIRVSRRTKAQAVTVTAIATDGISALGECLNRKRIREDVQRLLDRPLPAGNDSEFLETVLAAETAGRDHALARLGGPLLRFLEFTTPEEASLRLGQLIVGAPAPSDPPFDLVVDWALSQGPQAWLHTVSLCGCTESQIIDAPFSFDGQVRSGHWTAEARLTWRGATLTHRHQSQPFLPAIHAWQVALCLPADEALLPSPTALATGQDSDDLVWTESVQTTDNLANILQPYSVSFSRMADQATSDSEAETPDTFIAYARTRFTSPDQRDAVLCFRSPGRTGIYVNGQEIEELPVEQQTWLPGASRKARQSTPLSLKSGKNTLLVRSLPPQESNPGWSLSCWFTTPGGEPITDLVFEAIS
jgi:alpha-glucosidase